MNEFLELIKNYGAVIGVISAAVTFIWSVIQFSLVRASEARYREFETFHKLIKEITEVHNTNNYRQIAALFELRFYPRYFPITLRILKSTMEQSGDKSNTSSEMAKEVSMLISFIEMRL